MSLTIDYITMPPKSQEVSQIQHGDQVRYEQSAGGCIAGAAAGTEEFPSDNPSYKGRE